jgi:hypothetical protein
VNQRSVRRDPIEESFSNVKPRASNSLGSCAWAGRSNSNIPKDRKAIKLSNFCIFESFENLTNKLISEDTGNPIKLNHQY